jgi:hypothetical protein
VQKEQKKGWPVTLNVGRMWMGRRDGLGNYKEKEKEKNDDCAYIDDRWVNRSVKYMSV